MKRLKMPSLKHVPHELEVTLSPQISVLRRNTAIFKLRNSGAYNLLQEVSGKKNLPNHKISIDFHSRVLQHVMNCVQVRIVKWLVPSGVRACRP